MPLSTLTKAGQRFAVFNADSKGTVKELRGRIVLYVWDHDLETIHEKDLKDFEAITYPIQQGIPANVLHALTKGIK